MHAASAPFNARDSGLASFLTKKDLSLAGQIGKGHSSLVFLAKGKAGQLFVAKVERPDSTRFRMAERESECLKAANGIGVGPKLECFDLERRIILMEYIDGKPFSDWLFSGPSKRELARFIKELFAQALALDRIGLDHGQLAGKGKNILVRKGRPVIIDFEKASFSRKRHNLSTIEAFLFRNPHGAAAKKVKEILEG